MPLVFLAVFLSTYIKSTSKILKFKYWKKELTNKIEEKSGIKIYLNEIETVLR